ncbi:MAG TPA: hypothetical protein VMW01_08770 [Williamwhitmania sp.]|nr:hypothetical protein [Williamwhitmania sp.]
MPISIYKQETAESIAWLCNDYWDLPTQIDELEEWLKTKCKNLKADKYIIDIAFDIRPNATGGGSAISSESMKIMAENNMDLFLSEYPNQIEDLTEEK